MPSCSIGFWVATTRKGIRQSAVLTGDGDAAFLHGFQQRGLGFRRRAVDFIREQEIGEHGPRSITEFHAALVLVDDLGAEDVGRHQVGGELDALEIHAQHPRDGLHQQRLGQSRHADEQAVAVGKKGGDQAGDDFLLADDGLGKLIHDRARYPGDGVDVIDFGTHGEGEERLGVFPGRIR